MIQLEDRPCPHWRPLEVITYISWASHVCDISKTFCTDPENCDIYKEFLAGGTRIKIQTADE